MGVSVRALCARSSFCTHHHSLSVSSPASWPSPAAVSSQLLPCPWRSEPCNICFTGAAPRTPEWGGAGLDSLPVHLCSPAPGPNSYTLSCREKLGTWPCFKRCTSPQKSRNEFIFHLHTINFLLCEKMILYKNEKKKLIFDCDVCGPRSKHPATTPS